MMFRKYQHIERFGTDSVLGIDLGECYIFPKLDGTNSSCWINDGIVRAGSRNRELTLENDNAGFYSYILEQDNIKEYLLNNSTHYLFGEWLVPHSLKTYKDNAWNKFYVFDVAFEDNGKLHYIPYDQYKDTLNKYDINFISPLKIIKNPKESHLIECTKEHVNNYLIEDGKGSGEGIVIKNYNFVNKYGNQIWAKIVTSEFKEKHREQHGAPKQIIDVFEQSIIDKYVTVAFVEKEYNKIKIEKNGWNSKYIPMLFGKMFYELINEEMWNILKDYKNPTIDFKKLNMLLIAKIKEIKKELF